MTQRSRLPTQFGWLLIFAILISCAAASPARAAESSSMMDTADDDDNDLGAREERRPYDLKKLRNFLLTSNAAERASKREQLESLKRELVREYLRSIDDPSPTRFEEIKKRFTFCPIEDVLHGTLCRRRRRRRATGN